MQMINYWNRRKKKEFIPLRRNVIEILTKNLKNMALKI